MSVPGTFGGAVLLLLMPRTGRSPGTKSYLTLITNVSITSRSVSEQTKRRALASVAGHPLQIEATGWAYCACDVFEESKNIIDRMRLTGHQMASLQTELQSVDSVLLVSFWSSETTPKPLSGGGKYYAFLVHPQTFAVLHSVVGTWRS